MFPMGIRIWEKNRMIYPVKFSVITNLNTHECSISTLLENVNYETKNFMMLTTGIAINGYIYEKDIVRFNDDDDQIGIVEFDNELGAFVAVVNGQIIYVNGLVDFCEIIGNVYEDVELYDNVRKKIGNIVVDKEKAQISASIIKESEHTVGIKKENSNVSESMIDNNDDIEKENKQEIKAEENIKSNEEKLTTDGPIINQNNNKDEEITKIEETESISDAFTEDEIDENLVLGVDEDEIIVEDEFKIPEDVTSVNLYIGSYCPVDDGPGTYTYILQYGDIEKEFSGQSDKIVIKRNELMPLLEGLKLIPENVNLKVFTKSKYVIMPFLNKWLFKWHDNDWKKNKTDLIQNNDLWQEVYDLYVARKIEWASLTEADENEMVQKCNKIAEEKFINK